MFKLFKWRKKSNQTPISSQILGRNNFVSNETRESLVEFLLNKGENQLGTHVLNRYYLTCSPLATSIDLIVQNSTNINPEVFDTKEDEFLEEHPVLDLLASPNAAQSYVQFMGRLLGLFLLHGEAFIIATGDITKEPNEIWSLSRQNVSLIEGSDGFIDTIQVQTTGQVETYFRHEVDGKFRFYNRKDSTSSIQDKEILQLKNFNPAGGLVPIRGRSQLQSLYFEIEQWIHAAQHNLSLLVRGATPSGIFTTDSELDGITDEQYQRLEQQIRNYWEGSSNAGRVAFLSNGIEFSSLSQSNKDLDFVSSKEQLQRDIYNRMRIPLPLVSEKTMTLANMSTSSLMLYDNAVKPLLNCVFTEINRLLMYRYQDSENDIITIDEGDIGALAPRRNAQAIQLQETGASTINDRRRLLNLPTLDNGADVVYGTVSDTPIAGDGIDDLETTTPVVTPTEAVPPTEPSPQDEPSAQNEPSTQNGS